METTRTWKRPPDRAIRPFLFLPLPFTNILRRPFVPIFLTVNPVLVHSHVTKPKAGLDRFQNFNDVQNKQFVTISNLGILSSLVQHSLNGHRKYPLNLCN
jgi:hypothetical protein